MTENRKMELPEIGYLFHYPKFDQPSDFFRLDVYITSAPSEKHFDVQRLRLTARDVHGKIENYSITHPWHFGKGVEVCPGVVILEDRNGEKEEAFTFGSCMAVKVKESVTFCTIVSSAPILEINNATPLNRLFIDEVELLLAQYRTRFDTELGFKEKLFSVMPLDLYTACVDEIIAKFKQFPRMDEVYHRLVIDLHAQLHRLDAVGKLNKVPPSLDQIFKD